MRRIAKASKKYSPPEVVETVTKIMIGDPDPSRICTSIVERSNLSMRTSIRRLTRLTNAFSKKWEHLKAMLAVYFAYYNFCRIHSSIRCTPAMESGITNTVLHLPRFRGHQDKPERYCSGRRCSWGERDDGSRAS